MQTHQIMQRMHHSISHGTHVNLSIFVPMQIGTVSKESHISGLYHIVIYHIGDVKRQNRLKDSSRKLSTNSI